MPSRKTAADAPAGGWGAECGRIPYGRQETLLRGNRARGIWDLQPGE